MRIKRGVWIAGALIGVILFGGSAVLIGYDAYVANQADGSLPLGSIERAAVLILLAGACASSLFFSQREIDDATKEEIDEEPAQWIKDMRKPGQADDQN